MFFCIIGLIVSQCTGEEKKNKMIVTNSQNITQSIKTQETRKISSPQFFKAGLKEIEGKKYGIYIVELNDSVWRIAEKYFVFSQYEGKDKKRKIGHLAYKINLINFSYLPGGVNDNLKKGEQLLIPLD